MCPRLQSATPVVEILISPSGVERSMVRKPNKRRRNFNLRMVRVQNKIAAGALDTLKVAIGDLTDVATDPYRLVTLKASYSWVDVAAIIDDGFDFGVAHGDYTAAEIEECLDFQSSIDRGDKIALEKSNRLVRQIGSIRSPANPSATGSMVFADGRQVKTRLNWYMATGDKLKGWIRNSSGVIWTTGSSLNAAGQIWLKDSV